MPKAKDARPKRFTRTKGPCSFRDLENLVRFMRGPDGCAWDREQKLADFRRHFRNESAEVLSAIRKRDYENLKEELGDVLYHIVFMSQIAREEGAFDADDVIRGLRDKIVRRHPHVFGARRRLSSEQVVREYRRIKALEKGR
jgi:tetrapyrrole methylase family protein / MazG family protein